MQWIWNLDQRLQHVINSDWRSEEADVFFRLVTWFGLDQVIVPIVVLLILVRYTRRCGWQCFAAYAIAGLSSMAIKRFSPRFRPGYPDDGVFVAPDEEIYLNSFPSGHTAIAFAVAFTILLAWPGPRRRLAAVLALSVATLVGLSRVYRGVHWPTDILASVAVAFLAALVAAWLVNRGRAKGSQRPSEEPA